MAALLTPNRDMEWFFFSPRDYKYANSNRSNRATVKGKWKLTGKPRGIKAGLSNDVIGNKRILTFYEGRAPNSSKTNYIMHEYDLAETELGSMPRQNGDFVLCRLKINPEKSHKRKRSSICDEADDMIAGREENLAFKELQDLLFRNGNVGECKDSPKDSCPIDENDTSTGDGGAFSDFEIQQVFAQLEPLLNPIQPQEQQDYPLPSPMHTEPRDVLHGNNFIAGIELQTQFGDYELSLTELDYYLQTTPSPSIDSHLPKSLGTLPPSNYSCQGYSALATGGTLQCS